MRSQILNLLKQNGNKFLSGEYLADTLKSISNCYLETYKKHYVIMAIILKVFLEVVIV